MKPVRELVGRELKWTQPHTLTRSYELKDGDETVATLQFRSSFGSLATARTAEGAWTFKRVGFFAPRVAIRVADSETDVGVFSNSTWSAGGSLATTSGRHLRANSNFWMTSFEFKDDSQEPLVRFIRIGGVFHLSSNVEITTAGALLPELPWLVALGWYLTIKMHDDSGGAAAAAAAG